MTQQLNPWDRADNAQLPPKTYFGQVFTDASFCVLQKGIGKVPFDPQIHPEDQKRTSIKVEIVPLAAANLRFSVLRELIAESRDWAGIVLPSLRTIGVKPSDLNEKWVQAELVSTGRTYEKNGETKELTTFKFLAVYPDEASCETAYLHRFDHVAAASLDESTPFPSDTATPPPASPKAKVGNDAERAVAAKFLFPLWTQAGKDVNTFAGLIANNPLTGKYFDLNSPEVLEIVTELSR